MLKFENFAKVGDIIKAYDFKPMDGRPDCFMAGRVIEKGMIYRGVLNGDEIVKVPYCEGYTIEILGTDSDSSERKGDIGYVPFEVDFMEYDGRIEMVATAEEVALVESISEVSH